MDAYSLQTVKKILFYITTVFIGIVAFAMVPVSPATAQVNEGSEFCQGIGGSGSSSCRGVDSNGARTNYQSILRTIFNIISFIAGAVAVVMIIVGGIKYVTSNGDNSQVSSAKSTIVYAVVGLGIVFTAYAIVAFISRAF